MKKIALEGASYECFDRERDDFLHDSVDGWKKERENISFEVAMDTISKYIKN